MLRYATLCYAMLCSAMLKLSAAKMKTGSAKLRGRDWGNRGADAGGKRPGRVPLPDPFKPSQ
eukprot:6261836-Pyramimonas_sp.AAC.1